MAQPDTNLDLDIPATLPLLPVRDIVIFPNMIIPLFVGRERSLAAVEAALAGERMLMLASQKEQSMEEPELGDLYPVGTAAMIMRMFKLSDGRIKILIQGVARAKILKQLSDDPCLMVEVEPAEEEASQASSIELEALMRTVREQLGRALALGKSISPEVMMVAENMEDPGGLADLVASNVGLKIPDAQRLLEMTDPLQRLSEVKDILFKEVELLSLQDRIQSQAKEEMGRSQREYYLREQLRAIQAELGEADPRTEDILELRQKLDKAKPPKEVRAEAEKQLGRMESMHPESAEYGVIRSYMDWLVDLPWTKGTKDSLDLIAAKKVLDEDHFDLEKVKDRILEFLAVRKLNKKHKGPILCFAGPPGVGKTSLGRSIARALGRKFVRISLGGMRDEAEIRGHRRTYIGALPGRIIQGIKQAGTNNPVFMLDEIDKLGADFRGDPSSALLEILDPEQNHAFSDHYINLPYDLSNVLFIATANYLEAVPPALRDRMEVIRLSGYTAEEKEKIAFRYLIPRQLEDNGLASEKIVFAPAAVAKIIANYTAEAGLRNLERKIGTVCRKLARLVAEEKHPPARITPATIERLLGAPPILPEEERRREEPGVATGLAWTEAGGEILHIEVNIYKGKGGLSLTGQLGSVMKESAQAALSYARARADELGIANELFEQNDIHIHVPQGAIPKDGPSAGITMASALISALTKRSIPTDIAMTGEVTLKGKVMPVGGVKEKVLAALRSGMHSIILPARNRKDMEDIPKHLARRLRFHFVEEMDEVLDILGLRGEKQ